MRSADYAMHLGVDCGGTSTKAALADARGTIIARGRAGPSNVKSVGTDAFARAIAAAAGDAFAQLPPWQPTQLASAWIGAAGIDAATDGVRLRAPIAALLGLDPSRVTVSNDALMTGAPIAATGIAAIAGTGSIVLCLSRDPALRIRSRVGGLGWLLGDEGSAYRIGRAALRAAIDHADHVAWTGRGETSDAGGLLARIMAEWSVGSSDELLGAFYSCAFGEKHCLACLTPLTFELSAEGNVTCTRIIRDQADRLARQIVLATQRCAALSPSTLCLGGSILGLAPFRERVLQQVAAEGVSFAHVALVTDAAADAAASLVHANEHCNV